MLPLLLVARVAAADPVHLRLGTQAIDGSRYMQDIAALSAEIAKRTHGAVVLDWLPRGDDAAIAKQLTDGTLDGGGLTETGLVALVPAMAAWGTPGLLHTYDDADRATAALDDTVRDRFAQRDLVFLMWADLGFAELFSTEPIASLAGVLHLAAPWLGKALDAKLTEAVADGRARAWAAPPLFVLAAGGQHARAMTALHYRYVIGGLVISRAAWSRLPAADQATVLDTCRAWQRKLRASWRKETARGIAALVKSGVTVATLPEPAMPRPAQPRELAADIAAAIR